MQELMKKIVIAIAEAGITKIVFYGFHVLAFATVMTLALWLGPKLKISRKKTFGVVMIVYPLMYLWMLVQYWVENGFKDFGGQNIVTIFIWVPVIAMITGKIMKIDVKTICCLVAPLITVNHAVGHMGCIFAGCCRSFPTERGLYVVNSGMYHFPIQPIEVLIAALIVVTLILIMKKDNYVPTAKIYPINLVLFGSTRFICEFIRDNDKIFLGCSRLSFHALFMTIVGVVALIIIYKKKKKNSEA